MSCPHAAKRQRLRGLGRRDDLWPASQSVSLAAVNAARYAFCAHPRAPLGIRSSSAITTPMIDVMAALYGAATTIRASTMPSAATARASSCSTPQSPESPDSPRRCTLVVCAQMSLSESAKRKSWPGVSVPKGGYSAAARRGWSWRREAQLGPAPGDGPAGVGSAGAGLVLSLRQARAWSLRAGPLNVPAKETTNMTENEPAGSAPEEEVGARYPGHLFFTGHQARS